MKQFFVLCALMGLALPFAGCEKKAEKKDAPAAAAPDASAPAGDAPKEEAK